MRRDRPTTPEQPGWACGLGSSGSLHLGATARYALRLTKGRRRSSFSGASRAHLGNVGPEQPNAAARWGASPLTRVYVVSEVGSSPRRLAASGATTHDRPS